MSTVEAPEQLAPESFAARLYAMLEPWGRDDEENEWALLVYCNALGTLFQTVENVVRDTPAGPGWSPLVDLGRCPDFALPWLAQFVGVRVPPGSTALEQRAMIAQRLGWERGTPAAIVNATAATLTGERAVVLRERYGGDAYVLMVRTLTYETPSPTATLNAILTQKPGGIVLDYNAIAGQDYVALKTRGTYATVKSTYRDYDAVKTALP